MIKNIKIKTYLISSFALILVLMNILGFCSIYYNQRLAGQSIEFYQGAHQVQLDVAEVRGLLANISGQIKEALIYRSETRTQAATSAIDGYIGEVNQRIANVKQRYTGDQQLLQTSDQAISAWLAQSKNLHALINNKQFEKAISEFELSYSPAETAMNEAVTNISEYAKTQTEAFYQTAVRSKTISLWVTSGLVIVAIAVTVAVCSTVTKSITVPLKKIRLAAEAIAKGDLHHQIGYEGKNEFGIVAKAMEETTEALSSYIGNIDSVLTCLSENDMTVSVDMEYVGEFSNIKNSMQRIASSLNSTILQLEECSEQVATGAQQVSESAQILSQGSAEQAGSVEEFSASITEISSQVQKSASYSVEVDEMVKAVGEKLDYGNKQMQDMLEAISKTNESSDQIAKIIKTIEDIAFQTNILALNAAVEAARAGEAGKGFAVVADEVRNLAGKSSEAAKNTTALIQASIQAVENSTKIAGETAKTLETVVNGAGQITGMVGKIVASSEEQANSLMQVTSNIEQISRIIQTNSATSEESAASSEELSSQAKMMKALVGRFHVARQAPRL